MSAGEVVDDDPSPFDEGIYEPYSEWLMKQPDLFIANGDMLVNHLESATMFDEFLEQRK